MLDILYPAGICALAIVVSAFVALFPVRVLWAWAAGALTSAILSGLVGLWVAVTLLGLSPPKGQDSGVLGHLFHAEVRCLLWSGFGAMASTLGVAIVRVPLLMLGLDRTERRARGAEQGDGRGSG